jgi:hypothetical protein
MLLRGEFVDETLAGVLELALICVKSGGGRPAAGPVAGIGAGSNRSVDVVDRRSGLLLSGRIAGWLQQGDEAF